jgi:hypothetical protein
MEKPTVTVYPQSLDYQAALEHYLENSASPKALKSYDRAWALLGVICDIEESLETTITEDLIL